MDTPALFAQPSKREVTGMYIVTESNNSVVDIIFVHGLFGDRVKTWTSKDGICWPIDLLPLDIPNARIAIWGYETKMFTTVRFNSSDSVDLLAQALLKSVRRMREEEHTSSRPIMFIAHSLGGIIIKQALVKSYREEKNVFDQVKAVIFFGTPHRGFNTADALSPWWRVIRTLPSSLDGKSVRDVLKDDAKSLDKQSQEFNPISADMATYSIVESGAMMPGMEPIVTRHSATIRDDDAGAHIMTVDGNHTDICKFQSGSDLGYKSVINFLREHVNSAASRISRGPAGSAPEVSNHNDWQTLGADYVQANLRIVEQLMRDAIERLTAELKQTRQQTRLVKMLKSHLMVVETVATLTGQDRTSPAARAVTSLEDPLRDFLSKTFDENEISSMTDDIADNMTTVNSLLSMPIPTTGHAVKSESLVHGPSLFDAMTIQSEGLSNDCIEPWFNELENCIRVVAAQGERMHRPVKIAVLDTGLNKNHPYLQDRIHQIKESVSFTDTSQSNDSVGHGTCVIHLVTKFAPSAEIYVGRVMDHDRGNANTAAHVDKAIRHATLTWEVDIITMSFGWSKRAGFYGFDTKNIRNAIKLASAEAIILFAAACNDGALNTPNVSFPANMTGVLCVNSASGTGDKSKFSPPPQANKDNFSMLGENIVGPHPDAYQVTKRWSGTSMATPIVAAFAALVIDFVRQEIAASSIRDSNERPTKKRKTRTGEGMAIEEHSINDHDRMLSAVQDIDGMRQILLKSMCEPCGGGYNVIKPWKIFHDGNRNLVWTSIITALKEV